MVKSGRTNSRREVANGRNSGKVAYRRPPPMPDAELTREQTREIELLLGEMLYSEASSTLPDIHSPVVYAGCPA